MRITAHMSFWMGIVFIVLALTMALLNATGGDADATAAELADARGYAIFWFFLTGFGVVMVVVSWLILKGRLGGLPNSHDT